MSRPEPMIGCRDECGKQTTESGAAQTGWQFLPIQNRWRCPECWRALEKLNHPTEE